MATAETALDNAFDPIELAPHPARALAAFVDYLVITAIGSFIVLPGVAFDFTFVNALLLGVLYFTLGNSFLFSGQTLGKRVFGLRTLRYPLNETTPYLSLPQSFLRYWTIFGVIILIAEIPDILFREMQLQGSPLVLELHMLLAMLYFFANISWLVFDNNHRGLHDNFCKTIVLRDHEGLSANQMAGGEAPTLRQLALSKSRASSVRYSRTEARPSAEGSRRRADALRVEHRRDTAEGCVPSDWGKHLLYTLLTLLLPCALWLAGVLQSKPISALKSYRFKLEAQFPIRIQSIAAANNYLQIHAISLLSDQNTDPNAYFAEQQEVARNLSAHLVDNNIIDTNKFESVEFAFLGWRTGAVVEQSYDWDKIIVGTKSQKIIANPVGN